MELDRKKKIIAGVAAVVICCGLGFGIAWGAGAFAPDDPDTTPVVTTAEAEEDQIAEGTVSVDFSLTGDGWEEGSSPFIAHVTGETADGAEVDFYHAVWPDGSTDTVALEQGSYEVTYVSAINTDGSIYRTADVVSDFAVTYDDVTAALAAESDGAEEATAITEEPETSDEDEEETVVSEPAEADPDADADSDDDGAVDAVVTVPVEEEFEKVEADDVTQEDLEEILDDLNDAVAGGDETLTGDAATEVVDTATGNAQNNPNADGDAIEEKKEEATTTVEETTDTSSSSSSSSSSGSSSSSTSGSTSGSGSSGSSSSGSSSSGSSGSTSGGGSSTSTSGSSTSGSSGSTSTSGSTSSHTHSWVAQTTQKWVVDQAAYDETVQGDAYYKCSVCGYTGSYNEIVAHNKEMAISTGVGHNWSGPFYETTTVHHDEVGHYETVTTGYKCSTCGATK